MAAAGQEKPKKNDPDWWRTPVMLFAKLSSWIAFPIIIAVYLGHWLDRKYGTEPWLFLATVGVSFLVSMFGLIKNVMSEYRKINDLNKSSCEMDHKDKK